MRKIAAILLNLSLAGILSLLSPALAYASTPNAVLSLDPVSGQFNQGCSVSISIKLDTGGAQTDGTDAILLYDPNVFSVSTSSIQNGTIYSDYPGDSVDQTNGRIAISGLASVSQAYETSPGTTGVLATVNFTVKQNAPSSSTQIKFDFDPNNQSKTTDSNVVERGTIQDVLSKVNNGTYTIGTGACGTTTPTTTTTVTTQPIGGLTTPIEIKQPYASQPAELKKLPNGGSSSLMMITIVGSVLTVIGILGIALL